jgi:hypothetical protein
MIACLLLAACGSSARTFPPPSRVAALAAIQSAQDHHANREPASLIQLALANQDLQMADDFIAAGQMEQAALMLAKAEDDANRATQTVLAAHRSVGVASSGEHD